MKILHIDTIATWGGGQNQIRILAEELKASGIKSYIATPDGSELGRRLSPEFDVITLPMQNEVDIFSALKIALLCRKEKIGIIHAHTGKAHGIGLISKSFLPGIDFIVHRRVNFPLSRNPFTRYKYLSKKVDKYIAVSSIIARQLSEFGVDSGRISVIKSAVDSSPYSGAAKAESRKYLSKTYGFSETGVIIGAAGRLSREKGFDTLISALQHIRENRNWVCLIAGDGPMHRPLKELLFEKGLEDRVILTGFIRDLFSFYSGIDIFAIPSLSEGLGTSAIEASVAGCCIVASDVGGLPEVIDHEKSGILIAPGDPSALSMSLNLLIGNAQLRERYGREAFNKARDEFSVSKLAKDTIEVYLSLKGHRSSS
ncbi:MAG: glycosyltransferase family 4 protein [Oligoflexales bacterium]|nr:glycosyltransferase family 4 protein [Oligoflexales bacterium]